MKVSKMEQLISSLGELYGLDGDAEILVADEDGWLHDFTIDYVEESFDGFDTVYPAGLKIVPADKNDESGL